jgi:3-oxoacyl-[acyl-carrier protein] reductase
VLRARPPLSRRSTHWVGYTRDTAAEWGAYGITCNAVCPGFIQVEGKGLPHREELIQRISVRCLGEPGDAAALVGLPGRSRR